LSTRDDFRVWQHHTATWKHRVRDSLRKSDAAKEQAWQSRTARLENTTRALEERRDRNTPKPKATAQAGDPGRSRTPGGNSGHLETRMEAALGRGRTSGFQERPIKHYWEDLVASILLGVLLAAFWFGTSRKATPQVNSSRLPAAPDEKNFNPRM
jgi:hypothetical protein